MGVRDIMLMKGIPASEGIELGKAYVLQEETDVDSGFQEYNGKHYELERFFKAIDEAKKQIRELKKKAQEELSEKDAMIFEAHLLILDDPEFLKMVERKIDEGKNVSVAVKESIRFFEEMLLGLNDEYMKERAVDVKDVGIRLIRILSGKSEPDLWNIPEDCVLVAKDLTPSQTAKMRKERIKAIVLEKGGKTSHAVIIARSFGIPLILGVKEATRMIKNGDLLIVDGNIGLVHVNPEKSVLENYRERIIDQYKERMELRDILHLETRTSDGRRIKLFANIGNLEELDIALKNNAEGIGLMRTEILFMNREKPPSEEEQFKFYRTVLERMRGKPVIIRTLDVGGDKIIPYLYAEIGKEENPFLGYRSIRLCLNRKDIFKTQLRALLRASIYGNLKIMFPMISCEEEVLKAKTILEECKEELRKEGISFDRNVKVGIMVETPAAALISDILAKEVDFFSIGTNDLIQYTLAVDRTNESVSYLYNPSHPAILRLIKMTIENAHKNGIEVGVCGEVASDENFVPKLIKLGVDELSVNPSKILVIKKKVLQTKSNEDIINM
ncbi:phosphoenolpyruvate-protein phosphotransferase [Thermotoga petrophila RKU-10]|uniref:Phosphoenolpyruvate-protein phosphotransferase n=2 Tax=Thermotoga petrophila TaxID=93929 RepID=D2C7T6_THEP2|nr:phosphoenolpyruvate-protein phosphotransferase [Thermotoga petrophila RKU-10]